MPTARIADKYLPKEVADGAVVVLKGKTLNGLIKAIRAIEPVPGNGVVTKGLSGRGIAISVSDAAADAGLDPLQFYRSGNKIGVWPGAVSASSMSGYDGIPTLSGTGLDEYPTITPPDDATTTYYIKATFTDLDLTGVTIEAATTPTDSATISYVLCGAVTVAGGVITALSRYRSTSLYVKKCVSGHVWGPA